MDRLDENVPAPAPDAVAPDAVGDAPGLPRPLAAALGVPLESVRWRSRLPGVAEAVLSDADDERVSLIRVRPGAGVPAHTHTAVEATLVLQGSLLDGDEAFGIGDVAVATDADDHTPRAGMGEDCICLTVLGGSVRFTGTFGRALNLFAE
jgi:putative transcriptional regulator